MRQGFTLIELLVVIILMVVLMGITAPMGSKIFHQFQNYVRKIEEHHKVNKSKIFSFIEAEEKHIIINDVNHTISDKGAIYR